MDNLRGAVLMTLAMLAFALEDTAIKFLSGALPTWQIVLTLGLGGAPIFATLVLLQREALWSPGFLHPAVVVRTVAEMVGMVGFVTALALADLSTATAIAQSAPLMVTLGAALFLGEAVGWRRWTAILCGFGGILLIVRPGTAGFDANALFAVVGVLGLALRDLATRRVPAGTSSAQLSWLAYLATLPGAGVLAMTFGGAWVTPNTAELSLLSAIILIGVLAYISLVAATRIGEISFVTPFRYCRMVFALILAWLVFAERPDGWMILGIVIIITSGLFTLARERRSQS